MNKETLLFREALEERRAAYPLESRAARTTLDSMRRGLIPAIVPDTTLLRDVTEKHLLAWLTPCTNATTWNNRLRKARSFFQWCIRCGYLTENPARFLQPKDIPYHEPETFSSSQVERILTLAVRSHASSGIGLTLVLGFFCGLRSAEIQRAVFEEINFPDETLRVSIPKGFYRGTPPRLIQLPRNASLWLRFFLGNTPHSPRDLIAASPQEFTAWKKQVLAPENLSWDSLHHRNVMRHTACTMHVAAFRNLAETQLFLGHTRGSDVTVRHYLGLVSQREAETYWHIYPPVDPHSPKRSPPKRIQTLDPRFKLVEVQVQKEWASLRTSERIHPFSPHVECFDKLDSL